MKIFCDKYIAGENKTYDEVVANMAPSATLGDVVIRMNGMERKGKLVIRSKVTSDAKNKKNKEASDELADKMGPSAINSDWDKKMNDARNISKGDELTNGFLARNHCQRQSKKFRCSHQPEQS